MKFFLSVVLIILIAFIAGIYLPWWSLAIVAFLVGLLIYQGGFLAFLAGFVALFILWGVLALIINIENQGLFAGKIANLLPLGGSSLILIFITALIGALVAGLAALTGSLLRRIWV
jgi:hypothetical protein